MSYETVIKQIKTLPEACLDDASKYLDFLLYQYAQKSLNPLIESDEEFKAKMQKGFDDMKGGRVAPVQEVFALIRWDTYECIQETLEILTDEQLLKDLSTGIKQINENKLVDFDTFKAGLMCTQ